MDDVSNHGCYLAINPEITLNSQYGQRRLRGVANHGGRLEQSPVLGHIL
jgi:hypothetical protein